MNFGHNFSLRLRLTLMYVGLSTTLLCGLSSFLYWDTHHFLLDSTATRLRAQAKPVIERWLYSNGESLTASPPISPPIVADLAEIAAPLARDLTSRDTAALVLNRDGQVLANGKRLPEEPTPPPPDQRYYTRALAGENEVNYIVDEQRTLVLLIPLRRAPASPDVLGVVQLSTPLEPIDQILWRQRLLLGMGIGLAIVIGTPLGLWLTSSALKPLSHMVVTCHRIAAGDLSQRVNLPHHRDEIGQLAAVFDEMVARIESTFEAQRRFVANAAHELRTPLTALQGSLEVLLRGSQDDPAAVARLTQGMYREVIRLARLCEQLLDLSRIDSSTSIRKQQVQLTEFIAEFVNQARLLAREREVILKAGPPITISADPDALKEVLFNLVDNAVQHTTEGGIIAIGWQTSLAEVEIWVQDNGEGIAATDLPYIFDPFYRGDRSRSRRRGGTGLGLTLARAIIEAHEGQIRAESRVGEGARFTITLPVSRLPGSAPTPKAESSGENNLHRP